MNTPWTDFLTSEGATPDGAGIRFTAAGAAPVPSGDAPVVVPLVHLGVIRSRGEDSATFLHNLFSNDVKNLGAGAAQWNSFNSPKGRMLASLLLWKEADGHAFAVAADIQPALLKKLSMYVLRSKAKLTDGGVETVLLGVAGRGAADLLARSGLPAPTAPMSQASAGDVRCLRVGQDDFIVALAPERAPEVFRTLVGGGGRKAGTDEWQLAMIRAGVPLITAATQEEFVAQMLNYDVIGGVSFQKGCYPGQEIVARTQYLGKLKKRMYRVHVAGDDAPAPGADIFAPEFGEQSAGKLVNVAPSPDGGFEALAVMQTSCAEAGDVRLGSPAGPRLSFLDLPYALP